MDPSLVGPVLTTRTGDISCTSRIGTGKRSRGLNRMDKMTVISGNDNDKCNERDNGGNNSIDIKNDRTGLSDKNEEDHIKKKPKISILSNTMIDDKLRLQLTSASSAATEKKNQYTGWTVPSYNYQIPTITLGSDADDTVGEGRDDTGGHGMTAQRFYKEYINQRRPVVLRSGNNGDSNTKHLLQEFEELHKKWGPNNEHLKQRAKNEHVMVEIRPNEKETFGKGHENQMTFGRFCDMQEMGDTMHYLTTQDVEANNEGRPELMAPFMKELRTGKDGGNDGCDNDNISDFPLRPKLMGNLVPQNINMWMGNASQRHGTSSGLHHDYHDNFYIMVRGRKRFRLYNPADADKMYTRGKLHVVHPNGRINYEGDVTTAYGADIGAHAAAKASQAKDDAEQKLAEAEQGVLEGRAGAHEELERAEELLDEAMEALIDAEMSDDDGGSFGDDGGGSFGDNGDTLGDDDDTNDDVCSRDEIYDSCDSSGDAEFDKNCNRNNNSDPKNSVLNEEEGDQSHNIKKEQSHRLVDKTVKNPDNFSKVEAHLLDNRAELKLKFPEMLNAKNAFCDVNAGDILYLPASWFHEVTSFSKEDNDNDDVGNNNNQGHLALNYWFHPPDAPNNFEQPYSTDFWPNDYKMRFSEKQNRNTT